MDSDGHASPLDPDVTVVDAPAAFAERGSALSRRLVAFYKELHGRGPIAAKTILSPALATTVLFGALTPGEQTLVAGGKVVDVEQMRLRTAELGRFRLTALAEEVLGVEVMTSITGIGVRDDCATETFLLRPGSESIRARTT